MIIRRAVVIIFGACLLLIVSIGNAQTTKESTKTALTAEEILDRMSKMYAGCKTYQDSGIVKTKIIQNNDEMITEKSFTTVFVRPDRFRYEYKEKKEYPNKEYRYIIWRRGQEVLSWWDIQPGIEKKDSLGMAIAGATGVSGGSAHTIPSLLLPDQIGGRLLTDIREAKRIADAMLENVNCYRIEGKYAGDHIIIWIDAKTFLVRLINTQHKFPDFYSETATSYYPVLDNVISDKIMEFDPQKQM